ncbi:hypothetical protein KDK_19540 [Dictyobacter kobayashii]|uniref:Uncharacterized protein n=2 Tax=Dictyobacter kobayashii TaxID=2014872 RepID=A0A402AGH6_9CHLR|nr:hypothetical protein KDK_19540 [Dictyobacter kobayashii]
MTGINWIDTLGLLRIQALYLVSRYLTFNRLVQGGFVFCCIVIAFVITAIYDWAMLLNHWFTFVLFASLCVLTTAIIDYIRTGHKQDTPQAARQFMPPTHSSLAGIPVSPPDSALNSSAAIPQTQVPVLFSFPDTPMPVPATPLVRVLETIDLSSTNIKHFLEIKPQSTVSVSKDMDAKKRSNNTSSPE